MQLLKKYLDLNRPITNTDVSQALFAWGHDKNYNRPNVIPPKSRTRWVLSDQIGPRPYLYPAFTRLLSKYLLDRCPDTEHPFPFTSISANMNLAARPHRDAKNEGPSIVQAFGGFEGGQLRYWPGDDGNMEISHDCDVLLHDFQSGAGVSMPIGSPTDPITAVATTLLASAGAFRCR